MLVFTRVYVCVNAKLTFVSFFWTFPQSNQRVLFRGTLSGAGQHSASFKIPAPIFISMQVVRDPQQWYSFSKPLHFIICLPPDIKISTSSLLSFNTISPQLSQIVNLRRCIYELPHKTSFHMSSPTEGVIASYNSNGYKHPLSYMQHHTISKIFTSI